MTKPARQSLTTLLRLGRHREDRLRHRVILARASRSASVRRTDLLRESMAECAAAVRQSLLEDAGTGQSRPARRRISAISRELDLEAAFQAAAEKELAERRGELAEAIRERRALASLASARAAERAATRDRRDQKDLDESFVSHRHLRLHGSQT